MKRKILQITLTVLCSHFSFAQAPRNVIMYIGDGFGIAPKTAARMAMGQGTTGKKYPDDAGFQTLALDKLKYSNMVTTHSRNSWITDSGPGASVYACGKDGKIDNEAISFDVSSAQPIETILEAAKKQGYAVGIVTTTRVTHATPAAFGSHIWFRDLEDYIAAQFLSSTQTAYASIYNNPASTIKPYDVKRDWALPNPKRGVEIDVILGGGLRHFYPNNAKDTIRDQYGMPISPVKTMTGKRIDSVDLVKFARNEGYKYVNSRDALLNMDYSQFTPENDKKLIGLFNASHMNYEQDRQLTAEWEPSLFEMTQVAIEILKRKGGKKGFFLIVEGGRIDHLNHANEGGISVVSGSGGNVYTVDADKEVYVGGGDGNYAASPSTARASGLYGSDYLIKEVLAYDYAVEQGRKLLANQKGKTLIFTSSDHECGGVAVVGLHDEGDAQANGSKIRTYAMAPKQNGISASSSGSATSTTNANPANVTRGDIDFGATSSEGWYPNYTTYQFQGRSELWPQVAPNGRRIVIAFGSNPLTNGNGTKGGGTPGNHTPQDVLVCADDNEGGKWASRITGHGLLDNTSLTQIMSDFLKLHDFGILSSISGKEDIESPISRSSTAVYPNPFNLGAGTLIAVNIDQKSSVLVQIFNNSGELVREITKGNFDAGKYSFNWDGKNGKGAAVVPGIYYSVVKTNNDQNTKKIICIK
ncbi:MAG: alkaline phosphatase [Bacteroidia bacterium]